MTRRAITTGSKFEKIAGYSRAVIDGEWVFISGTAGNDPVTNRFPESTVDQAKLSLTTIGAALQQASASFADVVRVRVYLADRADVLPVSALLGDLFGEPRPANTTIICGFPDAQIKVEIEMTALVRR